VNFKQILAVAAVLVAAGCAAPVQQLVSQDNSGALVQAMQDGPQASYGKQPK
jgi:hypothetical protein